VPYKRARVEWNKKRNGIFSKRAPYANQSRAIKTYQPNPFSGQSCSPLTALTALAPVAACLALQHHPRLWRSESRELLKRTLAFEVELVGFA
jgi:hypothetical protein